jgi:hypothetical protein
MESGLGVVNVLEINNCGLCLLLHLVHFFIPFLVFNLLLSEVGCDLFCVLCLLCLHVLLSFNLLDLLLKLPLLHHQLFLPLLGFDSSNFSQLLVSEGFVSLFDFFLEATLLGIFCLLMRFPNLVHFLNPLLFKLFNLGQFF